MCGVKKKSSAFAVSHLAMVSGPPPPCRSSGWGCPSAPATGLQEHTQIQAICEDVGFINNPVEQFWELIRVVCVYRVRRSLPAP